jgi:endoglucanase
MFKVKNASVCVAAGLFLLGALNCVVAEEARGAVAKKTSPDPFEQNKRLGRGVNLGNALEAPKEGEWGVTLKEEYFKIIKDAGFNSVRIPCRWSAHALNEKPYTIDPNFFSRVDWAIKNALQNNLYVILNLQHYLEIYSDPNGHSERFLGLWKQIAEHYKDYPDSVLFELMNEPKDKLTAKLWNELMKKALAIVRQSNPRRTVVIGPANNNVIQYLKLLDIPKDDRNIIVSIHYYSPLRFTHQGAPWVTKADPNSWLGTKWPVTDSEKKTVVNDFNFAAQWAKENNRPMNLGEFGAYEKADMDSRVRWTTFVAKSALEHGFSYLYWEFCHTNFGIYDPQTKQWREPLLRAIIQPDK